MTRSRTLVAIGAVAGVLAVPVSADAEPADVSAAARLEASANVNTGWAATAARRSPAVARRLLRTGRTQLTQAQRLTVRTVRDASMRRSVAVQAADRFSLAVRRNGVRLQRLAGRSSGRLQRDAARALEANRAMQADVAVALAVSGQGLPEAPRSEVAAGAAALASVQAQLTGSLLTALDVHELAARTRRQLQAGVARGAEAQARISGALVALHAGAQGHASSAVADASARVAQVARDVHARVCESRFATADVESSAGERTSLGELSAQAAARVQADVDGMGAARVQGGAQAKATIGLGPLG